MYYFIGIKGSGMASLARILYDLGYEVAGSDIDKYIFLEDGLRERNIPIQVGESTNYKTDKKPVRMDYLDDIDIAEFKEIPTYKRMCICILRNDHVCKYMGFALTKEETLMKNMALKQYGKIFKDE